MSWSRARGWYTVLRPGQHSFQSAGKFLIPAIHVAEPASEINMQVYVPTAEALATGGCRQIRRAVGCIAVNVEYRLSPEYPHPTPASDGYQALQWVVKNEDVPVEGSRQPDSTPYESYVSYQFAPMLPPVRLVWYYNLWLGKGEIRTQRAEDFRASPIVVVPKQDANLQNNNRPFAHWDGALTAARESIMEGSRNYKSARYCASA
ncbi:hypothetical protein GQ53DRAFT_776110 [Thozetella sp. PMI_491]|nr:hypothetical protein GQ53DRAFT_776110 [Thozetella sp. PMI_491]